MLNVLGFLLKNTKVVMGIAIAALIAICFLTIKSNISLREDNERLENNQIALTKDIETYKTKDGHNAAKVNQLEMTVDEFKNTCSDQEKIIKELGIKVKRLEHMSSTGTSTDIDIDTKLKDTVYITKMDTLYIKEKGKHFYWADTWNSIEGKIIGDNINCKYHGTDTLNVIGHRVPKKFLFFRWGTKYIEVTITNRNTSSKITYNKTIVMKK